MTDMMRKIFLKCYQYVKKRYEHKVSIPFSFSTKSGFQNQENLAARLKYGDAKKNRVKKKPLS